VRLVIPLAVLVLSGSAEASVRACMLESSYFVDGHEVQMRDCMQAPSSASEQSVKDHCSELAAIAPSLGGVSRGVTYLPACPLPAQAKCSNYLGSENDAYYYQRAPSDLALLPRACTSRGGAWHPTE
jgi:hypothetical protein